MPCVCWVLKGLQWAPETQASICQLAGFRFPSLSSFPVPYNSAVIHSKCTVNIRILAPFYYYAYCGGCTIITVINKWESTRACPGFQAHLNPNLTRPQPPGFLSPGRFTGGGELTAPVRSTLTCPVRPGLSWDGLFSIVPGNLSHRNCLLTSFRRSSFLRTAYG